MAIRNELHIRTPENVRISYDLAGLGTRFFALITDSLIQYIVVFAFGYGLEKMKVFSLGNLPEKIRGLSSLYATLLIIFMFMLFFGYFIFFELFWDGQTPGKKIFGLKVRRNGGRPVDFLASMVRNLLRVVDMLPSFYLLGFIFCFCHPQTKRLGDMAAGTIVIKERKRKIIPVETGLTGEAEANIRAWLGGVFPPSLNEAEIGPIREFLRRRKHFSPAIRLKLSKALYHRILLYFVPSDPQSPEIEKEAERVLEVVYRWSEQERFGGY